MKSKLVLVLLILFGMVSTNCVAQNAGTFADLCQTGQTHQKAERYAEARAAYERALAVEGITPDQTGQALVRIGDAFLKEKKVREGVAALQKARAMKEISNRTRIEANLLFGDAYLAYPWVLDQCRDAFTAVLNLPEATPEQKTAARKGLVKAFMGLRQFADARTAMTELLADAALTPAETLEMRKSVGTTYMLDGKYPEARDVFAVVSGMEGLSDADKAHIQLQVALSHYEAGDHERAKPELEKLLTMPGASTPPFRNDGLGNSVASPVRAARLRLLKMEPGDEKEETLTVLFIGSSMTIRGYMPLTVEDLASSAPAGQPRIMAGMYVRGGTEIDTFWNNGETRDTARGMIGAGPWDVVVFETFCRISGEDLLKYGKLFADFNRTRKIKTVFYESQPPQAVPYPEDALKYHENNVELATKSNAVVAPVLLAEMRYLEAVPTAKREEFYDDWVHPSEKGRYMAACCIYSAITGHSPVGLRHSGSISDEEASALQEAAWEAVQEANPHLKPLN